METQGRRFGTGEDMCDEFYQRRCIQQFYENFFLESRRRFCCQTSREITYGFRLPWNTADCEPRRILFLISCSEESWININQNDGVIKISRNSTVLGEQATRILLQNIHNLRLYEQTIQEIDFSEKDIRLVSLPEKKSSKQSFRISCREKIRFLSVDNPTIKHCSCLPDILKRKPGFR